MSVSEMDAHRRRRRTPEPGPVTGPGAEVDEAIGLDRVAPHHWQVVDRRRPIGDPFRVLALIASVAGSYEVMQFGRGFEWSTFPSLDHALAHVVVTSAALARIRGSGVDAWAPEADDPAAQGPRAPLHALPRPTRDAEEPGGST